MFTWCHVQLLERPDANLRVAGLRHAVVDGCTSRRVTLLTLHLLLLLLLEQHGHRLRSPEPAHRFHAPHHQIRWPALNQNQTPAQNPEMLTNCMAMARSQ